MKCPKCINLHLIADSLGIFEEKGWNISKYLGDDNFNAVSLDDILELTAKTATATSAEASTNGALATEDLLREHVSRATVVDVRGEDEIALKEDAVTGHINIPFEGVDRFKELCLEKLDKSKPVIVH